MLSSFHNYSRNYSVNNVQPAQMALAASKDKSVSWLTSLFAQRRIPSEGFERNITNSRELKRLLPHLELTHKEIHLIGTDSDAVNEVETLIVRFGGRSTNISSASDFEPLLERAHVPDPVFFIFLDNFPLVDFKPLQLIAKIKSQLPGSSLYLLTAAVRYSDTNMGYLGGSDGIIQLPIDPVELAIALE